LTLVPLSLPTLVLCDTGGVKRLAIAALRPSVDTAWIRQEQLEGAEAPDWEKGETQQQEESQSAWVARPLTYSRPQELPETQIYDLPGDSTVEEEEARVSKDEEAAISPSMLSPEPLKSPSASATAALDGASDVPDPRPVVASPAVAPFKWQNELDSLMAMLSMVSSSLLVV
jgi:hypothetical protein